MNLSRKLILVGITLCLLTTSSCGYFLYPERVGQKEGKIDPAVVILDTLGLFIGIVPGVVAFAVDLTTGTIYLPPGGESAIEKHRDTTSFLENLHLDAVPPTELPFDQEQTARELSNMLGIEIDSNAIQFYSIQNPNQKLALRQVK